MNNSLSIIQHHKGVPVLVPVHVVTTLDTPSRHVVPGLRLTEDIIIVRHEHPSTRAKHFTCTVSVYNTNRNDPQRVLLREISAGGPSVRRKADILAQSETVLNELRTSLAVPAQS